MPVRGYWRLSWEGGDTVLNPGDTAAVASGPAAQPVARHDRRGLAFIASATPTIPQA